MPEVLVLEDVISNSRQQFQLNTDDGPVRSLAEALIACLTAFIITT